MAHTVQNIDDLHEHNVRRLVINSVMGRHQRYDMVGPCFRGTGGHAQPADLQVFFDALPVANLISALFWFKFSIVGRVLCENMSEFFDKKPSIDLESNGEYKFDHGAGQTDANEVKLQYVQEQV